MSTKQHKQDESTRDRHAYEENWYRVLKAISKGDPVELGEVSDPEIAELIYEPEVVHRVA